MKKQKFAVISHTHWDREWYMPFSVFRLKLVGLIDRLLGYIEADDRYIFHLDAQTVVLEDYLEIRPHKREQLEKYIAAGNIVVGPWYLQNDFFLTSGEATVRNLAIGTALAEHFGKCSRVGYAPDQFGNISQLPQILDNFGIDGFFFARGYKFVVFDEYGGPTERPAPDEFIWRGADGTEKLAVFMRHWYNNAQTVPVEPELAKILIAENAENFAGNPSGSVLLMNGVDHLDPQPDVRQAIDNLRKEGIDIEQTSLDAYLQYLTAQYKAHPSKWTVYGGALDKGHDGDLLKGCRSSRVYLKRANVRAEDLLQNKLEPLYAYLEGQGLIGVYPHDELHYLWKQLLRNHPHDNICGCSRDEVHAHMEDSYLKIEEMGGELLRRGLETLSGHADSPYRDKRNYAVSAFNPSERPLSAVVEAVLAIPVEENVAAFGIFDGDGNAVPFETVRHEKKQLDVFSPRNLPGVLDVDRYTVRFISGDVPAFSARSFAVVPQGKPVAAKKKFAGLENARYRIAVDGKHISIRDKRTGATYDDPFYLADQADKGDSYLFRKTPHPPLVIEPAHIEVTENSAFCKSCRLDFAWQSPISYDFDRDCRTDETVATTASITVRLNGDADTIELDCTLDNRTYDHRVRLGIRTPVADETLITDSAFDWCEKARDYHGAYSEDYTVCNATFVSVKDALTLFTEGLHEAEKVGCDVLLTLVRANGVICKRYDYSVSGGDQWLAPENRCLRVLNHRIGLRLGASTPAQSFIAAKQFRVGLLTAANSFDPEKYSGGRFAVQGAAYNRLYYLPDRYADCRTGGADFTLEGDGIVVTAYKCDRDGNAILRAVNFDDGKQTLSVRADGDVVLTDMRERDDYRNFGKTCAVELAPRKIVTLKIKEGAR